MTDWATACTPARVREVARRTPPLRGEVRRDDSAIEALARVVAPALAGGWWAPQIAEAFALPKPGRAGAFRMLVRLCFEDRVAQRVLLNHLQRTGPPAPPLTCAYVPGRGASAVTSWLHGAMAGGAFAGALDVVDFFPSVDRCALARRVGRCGLDPAARTVLTRCIEQRARGPTGLIETGLLQGALLSPWLSNLYLRPLDLALDPRRCRRYCDNLFVTGDGPGSVQRTLDHATAVLARLGLTVRRRPEWPADPWAGIEALGCQVDARGITPGRARRAAFLRRVQERLRQDRLDGAMTLVRGYLAYHRPMMPRGDTFVNTLEEVDDLLRRGRVDEALSRLQTMLDEPDEPDEPPRPPEFVGDPERHVRLHGARRQVIPRGLTPADRAAHATGVVALGVLPVDRQGRARLGVLDVDAPTPDDRDAAAEHTMQLAARLRNHGAPVVIEDTGGRGFHIWIPYDRPRDRSEIADELLALDRELPAPRDVRVEVFPGDADGDPHVRLPGGPHPRTGRVSRLVEASESTTGPHARRVLGRCSRLEAIARKAQTTGHLNHDERYSLAAILGHLGAEGERAVHEIISHCDNYDHETTQSFLDRRAPKPLGCRRLAERHPELPACDHCPPPRAPWGYPTPLTWARTPEATPEPRPTAPREDTLARLLAGVARSLARVRRNTP